MKKQSYILLLCVLSSAFCFGQRNKIDSLLTLIKTGKADTVQLLHLNKLAKEYINIGNTDSALLLAHSCLQLSGTILNTRVDSSIEYTAKKQEAISYNSIANVYSGQGNYPEALKNYALCLTRMEAIGNKKAAAYSYNNIGLIYYYQGNYPEALKNNFSALKIREAIGDKQGEADSYNNMGVVFYSQGNYPEAIKNANACLKICKEIDYKNGISTSYSLMGGVYESQGNYQEALKNHLASLQIEEELNNKEGIARSYNNMGVVYEHKGNQATKGSAEQKESYELALKNYFTCLKIEEETSNKAGIAPSYNNIGILYTKQKQYQLAEEFLLKGKELSKEIGYKIYLKDAYIALTELDSAKGDFKSAYADHKSAVLYRDSIDNEETRKKTIQSQMTYDFEKKEAVAEVEHKKELEKQQAVADEKSRKQRMVLLLVIACLLMVVVFAGFIFRTLRITRKQKHIIELQKNLVQQQKEEVELQKSLVEEKQKEIIDSITYARRIQQSLLPTEKYIEKHLKHLTSNT